MRNHSDINLLNTHITNSSDIINSAIKTNASKIIKTSACYPALLHEFCQMLDFSSSFKLQNNEGDYFKITLLENNIDYIAKISWDIIEHNLYGDLGQNGAIMVGRGMSVPEIIICLQYGSGNFTVEKHERYRKLLLDHKITFNFKNIINEYELMTKYYLKSISLVHDGHEHPKKEIIETPSFILFAPHHVNKILEIKIFFELLINNYIVPEKTKLLLYEEGGCLILNEKNNKNIEYQIFTYDESEILNKNEQRKLSLIKHPINGYVFTMDMFCENISFISIPDVNW